MERKNCRYGRIVVLWLVGLCHIASAQELVPNGGFSFNDTCELNSLPDSNIEPWLDIFSTPDFLHPCFPANESVPISAGGGEAPFIGEGYSGLFTYRVGEEKREFIATPLVEELSPGISYHALLYVSMMDSAWYATKSIGMFFSENIPPSDLESLFEFVPQVEYEHEEFLTNKGGWIPIEGSFVANGGERYLTIGNFKGDSETDTLFIEGGGFQGANPDFWKLSYYYVDGVSVIPDSIYLGNNDIEVEEVGFELYPNPNVGEFVVDLTMEETDIAEMTVFSISGQMIQKRSLNVGSNRLEMNEANGLYLYVVTINGKPEWTGKVSILSD
jgi:hypothetical protein